ncbi:MAG: hypothetical protein HGGPFJEG_02937 [Ignavibacteria bacterium]|nr:hypothetical protein [Ignavibacteria bacterium]
MNSTVKKSIKFFILFSITGFFLYLAFRGNDFNLLFIELRNANYFYAFAGAFTGIIIGGIIRALRWRYFLNPLKEDIVFSSLFSSMMVGYMMNSIIPRSGEIYRPVLLAKKEKISRTSAFATILAERVFDTLSLLISFGICLFYFRSKLSSVFEEYNLEMISLITSGIVVLFILILLVIIFNLEKSEVIIEKITKKIFPEKIHMKVHYLFISLINGFLFIKYPKYYGAILFYSILLWLSYVISTYLTLLAFSIDLNLLDANLVLTMITFALSIPLPANSAGLFHLFATATLVNIYGVNQETAFGFATVNHLLGLLGLIIIGAYYFLKENISFKKAELTENSDTVSGS